MSDPIEKIIRQRERDQFNERDWDYDAHGWKIARGDLSHAEPRNNNRPEMCATCGRMHFKARMPDGSLACPWNLTGMPGTTKTLEEAFPERFNEQTKEGVE